MSLVRIIRYGLLLWLIGFVVAFIEIYLVAPATVVRVIFYGENIVLAVLFTGLFFARLQNVFTMRTVAEVLGLWIALELVLDLAVFWWFYNLPFATVISLETIIGFAVMLCAGLATGWFISMQRKIEKPEGLA